ncbi:MAG: hypothetical protein H5T86_07290 [Armatimonadetes bacterium]|nr:hypothetical protein [Armatimonadota bacterium]
MVWPVIVAHRGYSARAPENTLAALRMALDAGVRACECDVRRAADGTIVLIHDATVGRRAAGPVLASTLSRAGAAWDADARGQDHGRAGHPARSSELMGVGGALTIGRGREGLSGPMCHGFCGARRTALKALRGGPRSQPRRSDVACAWGRAHIGGVKGSY